MTKIEDLKAASDLRRIANWMARGQTEKLPLIIKLWNEIMSQKKLSEVLEHFVGDIEPSRAFPKKDLRLFLPSRYMFPVFVSKTKRYKSDSSIMLLFFLRMRVFLVRHGQSESYELGTRQTPDSRLSKLGRKEALVLGRRIKRWGVSFDKIFSSKLPRARETSKIIARQLEASMEVFEGIHEREQHPDLYGAELHSKIHQDNVREYNKNLKNLDFKFLEKGESIRDVIKRAADFKKHLLKNHSQQDLLVISHGLFIRAFVTICILGDDYHDNSFADLFAAININNTGVSLLKYEEDSGRWKVVYLNNFSHLNTIKKSQK